MIEVVSGGRHANIWLDALPDWTFPPVRTLERRQPTPGQHTTTARSAAIELFVPTGARALYGALAARFTPDATSQLVIRLPLSDGDGLVLRDTLARRLDDVRVGLPEEFAEGIVLGLLDADVDIARQLGSGTLSLVGGMHGPVGSSSNFFRTLSRIVVRLLRMNNQTAEQEVLVTMIREELTVQNHLATSQ